jgi:hypothetical protein
MTRETFLLLFVLGAAALAVWVAQRLPGLAPRSFRAAAAHLAAALMVGSFLGPALRLVPGQPGLPAVLTALFAIALPVLTYMLLAGMWLLMFLAGSNPLARRR